MHKLRTLIVTDDDDWRALFATALLKTACEVHTTSDGSEAGDMVRKHHYDLLVVDKALGRTGQVEFVLNVRDLSPKMPLILICGSPTESQRAIWARTNVFFAGSRAEVAAKLPDAVGAAGRSIQDSAPQADAAK